MPVAKLPTLVTALAEVDGRDRQSVEHIGRTIRERGYIPTGKRGAGAAEMSAREAANFLMALNGADTPKDGPIAIDRFRSLRQWFSGTADDFRAKADSFADQPEAMQAVADCRTFGEAVEALIEGVPSLVVSFFAFGLNAWPDVKPEFWRERLLHAFELGMFGLDITFRRYAATIEVFVMFGSERRVQCDVTFGQDRDRAEAGFYGTSRPDRKVQVVIGMPTLIAAWQALHPGETLPGIPDRAVRSADEADAE